MRFLPSSKPICERKNTGQDLKSNIFAFFYFSLPRWMGVMMMRDALEVGPWDKWAKTLIHAIPHIPQKKVWRGSHIFYVNVVK